MNIDDRTIINRTNINQINLKQTNQINFESYIDQIPSNIDQIPSNIDQIPLDVWAYVLGRYGYLSANAIARTCKLFNKAVYKEQFWTNAIQTMFENVQSAYDVKNYYKENKTHLTMIANYIQRHFFDKNISTKPIHLFDFLKWIFDKDYINIKFHEYGCSVHFRNFKENNVLIYFVGYDNIKTFVRGKVKTKKWPLRYDIDRSVYLHHPYHTNVKIAYYFISNLLFVPRYMEYHDNNRIFCGIGYHNEDGLITPGKKGRWFNNDENSII